MTSWYHKFSDLSIQNREDFLQKKKMMAAHFLFSFLPV